MNFKLNYNDNIGRKYKAPFIKTFTESGLSELEELKRAIRLTKMDLVNNIGNRENLLVNISAFEKRIREIEEIDSSQSQLSELSNEVVIEVFKETEVRYFSSETQKVEDKYKKETITKSSSTWKKIDFSGRTPYTEPNSVTESPTPHESEDKNNICQHCFKIVNQVRRCPKCNLDLCLEHLSNHSCIKNKVEENLKKEPSEYIIASKPKKPWWKFW